MDWITFHNMEKEREMNQPTKEHYYFARVVMAIAAIFHRNPSSLKLENFLLKFTTGETLTASTKEEAEAAMNRSKSIWAAMAARLGFKKKEPVGQ